MWRDIAVAGTFVIRRSDDENVVGVGDMIDHPGVPVPALVTVITVKPGIDAVFAQESAEAQNVKLVLFIVMRIRNENLPRPTHVTILRRLVGRGHRFLLPGIGKSLRASIIGNLG